MPFELACGIAVQDLLGFLHRGARADFGGHAFLFGNEPFKFLDAPGVGLLEVHGRAEEFPGGQRVPVPAHGILGRGDGQQFGRKEIRQLRIGRAGRGSAVVELCLKVRGKRTFLGLCAGRHFREEAVLGSVLGALFDDD